MIAAQIWVRRRRILRPAAAADLTGIEACLDGVFAPRDQGFARSFLQRRHGRRSKAVLERAE
jgi:hypothetical protein